MQTKRLPTCLSALLYCSADFEQAARALERLVVEGTRTVDAQPRARYLLQPQGTDPSPLQCLEAVEDVW